MWYTMCMPASQPYFVQVFDADLPSLSRVAFFVVTAPNPGIAEAKALDFMAGEPGDWQVRKEGTKHASNASEYALRHATNLVAS